MAPSKLTKLTCIPGMLIFGTSTVVTQKIIFSMSAINVDGVRAKFEKPWFQTEAMFVGMMLCLVVYEIQSLLKRLRTVSTELSNPEQPKTSKLKEYIYVLIPAMCDMCATCMMNVGLVWIAPSIWQMLRGSMIIFSSIFSVIFLKQKKYCYHWTAVGTAVTGLLIIAGASLKIPSIPDVDSPLTATVTNTQKIIAICLVVGAQIIQASQIVIEEYLLKNIDMDASLIVGLEGLWGTVVLGIIMVPLYYTPVSWEAFHENTIDSFKMMGNNHTLIWAILLYIFFILFYNLYGMMVTQTYSAVYRTILEAVRTLCIWITNLIIYKFIDKRFGEIWSNWSWLEAFGFLFILAGSFLYNKVIRLPFFNYHENDADINQSLLVEEGK